MSHNELSEESLGLLADAISVNTCLLELFFTHNDLSSPNGMKFIKALSNKKQLNILAVNSCNLNN